YPLPQSLLDRFGASFFVDVPNNSVSREILRKHFGETAADQAKPVQSATASFFSLQELEQMQAHVRQIHVSESLMDYVLALMAGLRQNAAEHFYVGPRALLATLDLA